MVFRYLFYQSVSCILLKLFVRFPFLQTLPSTDITVGFESQPPLYTGVIMGINMSQSKGFDWKTFIRTDRSG